MVIQTVILSLIGYIGIYCGLFLGFIAPEEINPIKKNLHKLTWALSIILFVSLLMHTVHIIPMIAIIGYFGWLFFFQKKLLTLKALVISIPFLVVVTEQNPIVASIIFLMGFPIGTLLLTQTVKKDKLTLSKKELLTRLFKQTTVFWISLVAMTALRFVMG